MCVWACTCMLSLEGLLAMLSMTASGICVCTVHSLIFILPVWLGSFQTSFTCYAHRNGLQNLFSSVVLFGHRFYTLWNKLKKAVWERCSVHESTWWFSFKIIPESVVGNKTWWNWVSTMSFTDLSTQKYHGMLITYRNACKGLKC